MQLAVLLFIAAAKSFARRLQANMLLGVPQWRTAPQPGAD
jgi:hypothetical protein